MRVVVTGSRDWTDQHAISWELEALPSGSVVIEGGARGADTIARKRALDLGLDVETYWANWIKHGGGRAGGIRNQRMLDTGVDLVLAFPLPGSRGTWDCVRRAERMGIEVRVWASR